MDESQALPIALPGRGVGAELKGLDAKTWLERLESRYSDLESALQWFLEHGRADEALRMAVSLPDFWSATGRLEPERALLDRVLDARVTDEPPRGRARAGEAGSRRLFVDGHVSAFEGLLP
jgi:hypothetical protein